jgi:hypothetical protein
MVDPPKLLNGQSADNHSGKLQIYPVLSKDRLMTLYIGSLRRDFYLFRAFATVIQARAVDAGDLLERVTWRELCRQLEDPSARVISRSVAVPRAYKSPDPAKAAGSVSVHQGSRWSPGLNS